MPRQYITFLAFGFFTVLSGYVKLDFSPYEVYHCSKVSPLALSILRTALPGRDPVRRRADPHQGGGTLVMRGWGRQPPFNMMH